MPLLDWEVGKPRKRGGTKSRGSLARGGLCCSSSGVARAVGMCIPGWLRWRAVLCPRPREAGVAVCVQSVQQYKKLLAQRNKSLAYAWELAISLQFLGSTDWKSCLDFILSRLPTYAGSVRFILEEACVHRCTASAW